MNIDAEKLNKSVNRYRDNAKAAFNPIEDDADYYKGKIDAYEDIQEVIASLQQEQPEGLHFTPLNRLIQKVPSKNWNDTVNNYAKKLRGDSNPDSNDDGIQTIKAMINYIESL